LESELGSGLSAAIGRQVVYAGARLGQPGYPLPGSSIVPARLSQGDYLDKRVRSKPCS